MLTTQNEPYDPKSLAVAWQSYRLRAGTDRSCLSRCSEPNLTDRVCRCADRRSGADQASGTASLSTDQSPLPIERSPLCQLAGWSDNANDELRFKTSAPLLGPGLPCQHTICARRRMRISRAVHYYYSDPSPLLDKRGGPVGLDEHGGSMAKYCKLTEEHRRIVQG